MAISFNTEARMVSSYSYVQVNYIEVVPVDNELGNWCIPKMTTNGMDIWPDTVNHVQWRETPLPRHTHTHTEHNTIQLTIVAHH